MAENEWREIEEMILSHGAAEVRRIDPRRVPTGEWVRLKCQFGCGGYGRCLTCPPHAPAPERTRRLLDDYTVGFLIHRGPKSGGRKVLAEMERDVFLQGYYKAFALGSGPCGLCPECDVEEPCRHPSQARPAMEASGIDVFQTARDAGYPIEVVTCREDALNMYSLLLVE